MSRLHIQVGQSSVTSVSIAPNPLSQAISHSISETYCRPIRRAGTIPALTLASSLVTIAGAQAAVFDVENLNDAGPGSLRQAVVDANSNPGPDGIRFDDGLNGTITLTTGQIDISDSVAIQGPGEAALTIDPEGNSRVFDIQNTYTSGFTEINDLTLVNGYTNSGGGAIRAGNASEGANRVSLRNVTISDSYAADGNGGAVYANNVFLDIADSTFSNNDAYAQGGAIDINSGSLNIAGSTFTNNGANEYDGGAIRADEMNSVVIDSSQFMYNSADDNGGAIALSDVYVNALVSNSTISNNTAGNNGGGIDTDSFASGTALVINNTTVSDNTGNTAGGIHANDTNLSILNNSMVTGNTASEGGGGMRFSGGERDGLLRIEDSNIDNNITSYGYGGGVHFYADDPSMLIRNSSISGNEASEGGGGGIAVYYNDGTGNQYGFITIQNSVISNNTAQSEGGGLMLEVDDSHQAILIEDSDFSGNSAGDDGGGLHFYFDDGLYTSLVIRNTTVSGNNATEGGGMWFYDDDGYSVNIDNSTFSGNTADESGGGLWFYSDDGAPIIRNSTFSGNNAGYNGGGMYLTHEDGEGLIDNSTITNNYAYESGGGVHNESSELQIRSSIIAGNTTYTSDYADISGSEFYVSFSLIEDPDGISLGSNNNNIFYVDPMLGPLADNGGPTMSHALMAGSPAIDTGLNAAPSADDQRGIGFERMVGLQTDMGAIESDTDAALTFSPYTQLVTNLDDSGAGSLRQAVIDANNSYGLDVIEFQGGLSGTITLTSGDIDIDDDLVINAVPSTITVSGGFIAPRGAVGPQVSRAFRIQGGFGQPKRGGLGDPGYNLLSVDIVGLTITDGYTSENGGAIYANNAEVTLRDSIITNSQAYNGGGIAQYGGVLRVNDSTISYNSTTGLEYGAGGGIYTNAYTGSFGNAASAGNIVIRGSLIDNNSAAYYGGGIHIEEGATLAIDNSTISNNSADSGGGGLFINDLENSASISNSIITANTTDENGGGIRVNELYGYSDSLTLDNTTVSYNTALNEGSGNGGGIFVDNEGSRLHIVNNSLIDNNSAYSNGGGIAFYADEDGDALSIVDSTISNNTSIYGDGGGVFIDGGYASLNIINSTFSGNSAENYGGGLAVRGDRYEAINIIDSTFTANSVGEGVGGGIAMTLQEVQAPIRIDNTQITNNTSNGSVGGLLLSTYYARRNPSPPDGATRGSNYGFYSSVTISDSTISGNIADDDTGGMRFSDPEGNYALTIDNSTISGNTATNGNAGGMYAYSEDGSILIRNTTISGNAAGEGSGGGFFSPGADRIVFANSTIVNNTASGNGGGIYSDVVNYLRGGGAYNVDIAGSVIAGNTAGSGNANLASEGGNINLLFSLLDDDAGAPVNDNGFNVLNQDPLLGALASNGGPTQTHALMAGSPAINAGLNVSASVNDQRGDSFPRTIGTQTDMGAFEAISNPLLATSLTGSPIDENGGMGTIDASLTEAAGISLFVDLTFGGVATLDTDFSIDGNTLFIPNDGTLMSQAPVTITGIDDNISEGDEPFTVDGTQLPATAIRGSIPQLDGIIADDKGDPTITLSLVGDPIAENGGMSTITATASNPSTQDITVNLAFSGMADLSDFMAPASIVIPMGMTSADITLTAIDDALDEPDEQVLVDIDTVTNGVENGMQQVSTTITDDDVPPLVTISLSVTEVDEGGMANVVLTLNQPSGQDIMVTLAFSGTATMPDDYTVSSNMLTIPAGMTTGMVTISATDDGILDPDETIIVDIDSVTNATEDGVQQGTVTIIEGMGPPVIDAPIDVPALSTLGKWLMALLIPLAGMLGMRRRKRRHG